MLVITAFLTTLAKLRIGKSYDLFKASLGFIKFEVPISSVTNVYKDVKSSLKYGDLSARLRKYKEGWILAYTTVS